MDDAKFIYEKIRKFEFFDPFFTENLRIMEFDDIISLCRKFSYDRVPAGKFVFNQGDASNNKFYVVISGQVAIIKTRADDQPGTVQDIPEATAKVQSPKELKAKNTPFKKPRAVTLIRGRKQLSEEAESKLENVSEIVMDPTFQNWLQYMSDVKKIKDNVKKEIQADEQRIEYQKMLRLEEEQRALEMQDFEHAKQNEEGLENYMSKLGILMSCKSEGEGFGSLALKNDAPRAASIFCKTDCEFLIITKQQFDLLFVKKERDREEFLKEVFPFISSLISSSSTFNNLFFSFQTEVFSKGAYLTTEGKIDSSATPKIFILFKGDCSVEKVPYVEFNEASNKKQLNNPSIQPVTIAIIGQGAIVGEEALINPEEYEYSVRVTSEYVIAYTITLISFNALFFTKDFKNFLLQLYTKKQNQRLHVTENLRREHESKMNRQKIERNNAKMNTYIKIPAKASPANDKIDLKTPDLNIKFPSKFFDKSALGIKKSKSFKMDGTSNTIKIGESIITSFNEEVSQKIVDSTKDAMRMFKAVDLYNPKNQKLISKLGYINGVHSSMKQDSEEIDNEDFEAKRFFKMEEISNSKHLKIRRDKTQPTQTSYGSPFANQKKSESMERITSVLKDVAQVARRYKMPNYNTDEDSVEAEPKDRTPDARKTTTKAALSGFIHTSGLIPIKSKIPTPVNKANKLKSGYGEGTFSSIVLEDKRFAPPTRSRVSSKDKYSRPPTRIQTSANFDDYSNIVGQYAIFKPVTVTNLALEKTNTESSVEILAVNPRNKTKIKTAAGFMFKERGASPPMPGPNPKFKIKHNGYFNY